MPVKLENRELFCPQQFTCPQTPLTGPTQFSIQGIVDFSVGTNWKAIHRTVCNEEHNERRTLEHSLSHGLLEHFFNEHGKLQTALASTTSESVVLFHSLLLATCEVEGLVTGAISEGEACRMARFASNQLHCSGMVSPAVLANLRLHVQAFHNLCQSLAARYSAYICPNVLHTTPTTAIYRSSITLYARAARFRDCHTGS